MEAHCRLEFRFLVLWSTSPHSAHTSKRKDENHSKSAHTDNCSYQCEQIYGFWWAFKDGVTNETVCCVVFMTNMSENRKFHHNTISYRFFDRRYDICWYNKICHNVLTSCNRCLWSIWDDIMWSFNTIISYIYINSQKATKVWFGNFITELFRENIIFIDDPNI